MLCVRDFGKCDTTCCTGAGAWGEVGEDGGLSVENGRKKDTRDFFVDILSTQSMSLEKGKGVVRTVCVQSDHFVSS